MTGPASYEELVAVATVGLDRRPLQPGGLAGPAAAHAGVLDPADPAAALLDAAALLSSARWAGVLPARAPALRVAAADTEPELSRTASVILAGALRSDPELAADLLAAAAGAGFRAAPPTLPALLDAAVRHRALRQPASAVLGNRGRWLAAHRDDWRRALGVTDAAGQAAVPAATDGTASGPSGDADVWQTAGRQDRRRWLAGLRRRDPAAARELLADGWSRETGDDRADLLGVLADQLSAADEPFLEAALDDRKHAVRQAAARLLAALPESAFTHRAIGRGAAALSAGRQGPRPTLVVALPQARDAAAARDGMPAAPAGAAIGGRAWLLIQYIAAVPLAEWTARLGLSPAPLAALPVSGGFRAEVHAGWRKAAVAQGDASWAAALLAAGQVPASGESRDRGARGPAGSADTELAMVLPPADRVAWAQGILTQHGPGPQAAAALAACPGPWSARLADAVLGQLARGVAAGRQHRNVLVILPLAARKLPATGHRDYAAELRALALAGPSAGELFRRLRRAADVIAYRRQFLQELQ
jgi:hypothetical protein